MLVPFTVTQHVIHQNNCSKHSLHEYHLIFSTFTNKICMRVHTYDLKKRAVKNRRDFKMDYNKKKCLQSLTQKAGYVRDVEIGQKVK